MRAEIIENISSTLKKPLEKERVVYLMIEIRKFIGKSNEELSNWNNLEFWCDWMVHTKMDRKFAKETLIKMEQYLQTPGKKFNWSNFNSEFISLENLRQELYKFLEHHNLSTKITDFPTWKIFCKYLEGVLLDLPIK